MSFIQAGLCDEVSVVISPTADGSSTAPSLFETREEGLTVDTPVRFKFENVETKDNGSVWLRYTVNHK